MTDKNSKMYLALTDLYRLTRFFYFDRLENPGYFMAGQLQRAAGCISSASTRLEPQEYRTKNVDNSLIVCGT